MSSLLAQDLNPDVILPYETWQLAIGSIWVVQGVAGIVSKTIVIIALSKQRSLYANQIFLLSMCLGNVMFLLAVCLLGGWHLKAGGFSLGPGGCVIQAVFILAAENISLLSIILMTLDRYLVILREKILSTRETAFLLSQVWVMPLVMVAIAFGTNSQGFLFGLQSSGLYCMMAAWDTHLINRIEMVLSIILIFQGIAGFFFVYGKIYLFYRQTNQNLHILVSLQDSGLGMSDNERRLLIKCSSLALSYCILVGPMWSKLVYEVATSSPVPASFDALVAVLVAFEPLASSILVFFFDYSLQSTIKEMLGISGFLERDHSSDGGRSRGKQVGPGTSNLGRSTTATT